MARGDSAQQNILEQSGRKTFIKKISLTAATKVITSIGTTDVNSDTLPSSYTLVIQPIGTDIYYELREAGATTTITDSSGARPGVYVLDKQQEPVVPRVGKTVKGRS
jgi:hypothetical protein